MSGALLHGAHRPAQRNRVQGTQAAPGMLAPMLSNPIMLSVIASLC